MLHRVLGVNTTQGTGGTTQGTRGWLVTGSHNLSPSAPGREEKNGQQLHVSNWELSVFFPPSVLALCPSGGVDGSREGALPLPFRYPPEKYGPGDQPFVFSPGAG